MRKVDGGGIGRYFFMGITKLNMFIAVGLGLARDASWIGFDSVRLTEWLWQTNSFVPFISVTNYGNEEASMQAKEVHWLESHVM